jgi:hypothetical protein
MSSAFAQEASFIDVSYLTAQSPGPILETNEIKGYYMFYKLDRVDRNEYSYLLQILDGDLNTAIKTTVTRSKWHSLLEVTYNGNAFALLFYDAKQRLFELTTLDRQGNVIGARGFEKLSNRDLMLYSSYGYLGGSEEGSNHSIFPVGDRGFLRLTLDHYKGSKYGYALTYYPNDLSASNVWKVGSNPQSGLVEYPLVTSLTDDYLTLSVARRKGATSKDMLYFSLLIDLKGGRIVYEVPMAKRDFNHAVLFSEYDAASGITTVMGNYYEAGDKTMKDKSLGIFAWQLDQSGQIAQKAYYSWGKDIAPFLSTNEKGRLDGGGYVYIHKAIRVDGRTYVVGEAFKKSISGAGVALNILAAASGSTSSGMANFKVVMMDMVVFELAENLDLKGIKVFEKDDRNVYLPEGFGLLGPTAMGMMMKIYGQFDYNYTEEIEADKSFYITYNTRIKEDGKGSKKPIFGIISHDETGAFNEEKIPMTTDATSLWIARGKPGYVSIWEYFRKEKTLNVRLEPVNY